MKNDKKNKAEQENRGNGKSYFQLGGTEGLSEEMIWKNQVSSGVASGRP